MDERFVPIGGFAGRYEVSNLGNVRSQITKRILKPGRNSSGYLTVNLYLPVVPKKAKSVTVHSLVAAAFLGDRPAGSQIDHKDGDKTNNALDNLHYVTPLENVRLQQSQGRTPKRYHGSSHENAKLNHKQVRLLRSMHEQGRCFAELGRLFGVSASTAANVVRRVTYACVK